MDSRDQAARIARPAAVPRAAGTPTLVVSAAATAAPAYARTPVPPPTFARPAPPPVPAPPPRPAPPMPPPAPAPIARSQPVPRSVRIELPQVVCWQLSVVAVLATLDRPWPVLAATSAGAAILLALTGIRVRGKWLGELAGLGCRFLLRQRRHDLPASAAKATALLGLLLPGSTVRPFETAQGTTSAISHAHGLTALLAPANPADPRTFPDPAALLPPPAGEDPEFAVQAAFHAGTRPNAPARIWLAAGALRSADHPGDAELELALRNALRRIRRALARAGIPADPPAEDAVAAAFTALAHVNGGRDELREDWRFWRTGPVSQACFALEGWATLPGPTAAALTARLLVPVAGVAVSLTVSARSGGGRSAVLRLAATTEAAVDATAARFARGLASGGVRLSRLDGSHFPAVAASLPIGGFPR
ncbi:type VII secretion protein EccE [Amycolatopsis sp. WGS_07]|uniref:type VII secretion protein EccE n=1 Tax=Amycolatopsis sp. WGS_07 TaxID=3076764 RepID=UPI003873A422